MKELAAALTKFRKDCGAIAKKSENPFFKSKYADLNTIWAHIAPHLEANGLTVVQSGQGGMAVKTTLYHESGESIESTTELPCKDATPQAGGSVLTYSRRYGLSLLLGLITEEDDDANRAQEEAVMPSQEGAAEIRIKPPQVDPQTGEHLCPVCAGEAWVDVNGVEYCRKKHWKAQDVVITPKKKRGK